MIRASLLSSSVIVVASIGLLACGGKSQTSTTTATTTQKKVTPRTPMSLMAKSANFAVVVRPAKLKGTKLGELAASFLNTGKLKEVLAACAINPLEDIHLVIVSGDVASEHSTAFVKGSFTKKTIDDCLAKLQANVAPIKVVNTSDMIEVEFGPMKLYARWVMGGLLASPIKARVDMTKLAGPPDDLDSKFAHFKHDALVSFAATTAALKADVAKNLPAEMRPTQAVGNVVLGGGITVDINAGMASDTAAKAALAKIQEALDAAKNIPMAASLVSAVKLATAGSDVTVDVALSEAQISMLINMGKMLMSMR